MPVPYSSRLAGKIRLTGQLRIVTAAAVVGYLLAWFWPWTASAGVISPQSAWVTILALPGDGVMAAPEQALALLLVALIFITLFAPVGRLSLLTAVLAGFLWGLWQVADRVQSVAVLDERVDCQVIGTITGLIDSEPTRLRFNLKPERLQPGNPDVSACPAPAGLLRVSVYYPKLALKSGQRIEATIRLRPNHGFANPGGFDYPRWLFRHQIMASGYLREDSLSVLGAGDGLTARVDTVRDYLSRQLDLALLQSPGAGEKLDGAAMLAGLSMGDRQRLSDAHWDALLATGTNHLLAISGLHVGLMAGLFGFLAQKLWRRTRFATTFPAQRAGALAAVIAAWGYALIAGLSIPTLRAALMLSILLAGLLFQRRWRLFDLWLLAMLAVLLLDPASPLDVGFWLSFAAVLVIIIAVQTRPRGWVLFALVTLQVLLFVGLLPLTWGMFDRIPWMSLPANLFAVPLVTLILTPLALLTLLVAALYPPAAGPLIWLADKLAVVLFSVLGWLVDLGPETLVAAPDGLALVLLTLGCLWLLMPRGWPGKGLAWLLFLPALTAGSDRPPYGALHLVVFDVGQGTAIYLQTRTQDYLYDTGPRWGGFDTGEAVVVPALRSLGVTELDKIILSHRHLDHTGGLATIHKQFPDTPIYGEPAADDVAAGIAHHPCENGRQWQHDGVRFTLKQAPFTDANEGSCVLMAEGKQTRLLLTGDIEQAAEHWLLRHYSMQAEVVYVPHHGSNSSSSPAFIERTGADIALNSAGFMNRFGHPHPEIVTRWEQAGVAFYNTADYGALFWESGRVWGYRERRWPFAWRANGQ